MRSPGKASNVTSQRERSPPAGAYRRCGGALKWGTLSLNSSSPVEPKKRSKGGKPRKELFVLARYLNHKVAIAHAGSVVGDLDAELGGPRLSQSTAGRSLLCKP